MSRKNIKDVQLDFSNLKGGNASKIPVAYESLIDFRDVQSKWIRIANLQNYPFNCVLHIRHSYLSSGVSCPLLLHIAGNAQNYDLNGFFMNISNLSSNQKNIAKSFDKIRITMENGEKFLEIHFLRNDGPIQIQTVFSHCYFVTPVNPYLVEENTEASKEEIIPDFLDKHAYLNDLLNTDNMQLTDNQSLMGGGITAFAIGDYAVTVRQKGGRHEPKKSQLYQSAVCGGEEPDNRRGYRQYNRDGVLSCEQFNKRNLPRREFQISDIRFDKHVLRFQQCISNHDKLVSPVYVIQKEVRKLGRNSMVGLDSVRKIIGDSGFHRNGIAERKEEVAV